MICSFYHADSDLNTDVLTLHYIAEFAHLIYSNFLHQKMLRWLCSRLCGLKIDLRTSMDGGERAAPSAELAGGCSLSMIRPQDDMRLVREVCGSDMVLLASGTEGEVAAMQTFSIVGLASGLFTRNSHHTHYVAGRI